MGAHHGSVSVASDFRSRAATLRDAAADPKTDLGLIRFMVDTAEDMETIAALEETSSDPTVSADR